MKLKRNPAGLRFIYRPGGITVKLIVGLGNPGEKYSRTRHNIGFRIIAELASQLNIRSSSYQNKSLVGTGVLSGEKVIVAQPCTYMNRSGYAVLSLMNHYNLNAEDIIIIYDDMDLPPGKIRIKKKGSSGGHKGLKSIIDYIETRNFPRIRIGIGRPPDGISVTDYVLGFFNNEEEELINAAVQDTLKALEVIIQKDFQKAMNDFN